MPVAPSCKSALAALSASSRLSTICPRGTATPYFERMAFAWYSCIFIFYDDCGRTFTRYSGCMRRIVCSLLRGLHKNYETGDCIGGTRARAMTSITRCGRWLRLPSPRSIRPVLPHSEALHLVVKVGLGEGRFDLAARVARPNSPRRIRQLED